MNSFLMTMLLTWQAVQLITIPHVVQVDSSSTSIGPQAPQPSQTIKGSQQPTTEIPYGEIFSKESGKLPFYQQPEFGGIDGGDHRRDVRPNAAGQRLNMDQYNRQIRPPVGP